jgi:hypothetical protein
MGSQKDDKIGAGRPDSSQYESNSKSDDAARLAGALNKSHGLYLS